MQTDDDHREAGRTSILGDLYIDLLGSLLPGLFTIVLSTFTALPSAVVAWQLMAARETASQQYSGGPIINGTPDVWLGPYGTTVLALVLAYIIGSVLYRQDPKRPDWRSARRVWKKSSGKDRERLAVQPDPAGTRSTITAEDAQFPYRFLYEYLMGRGLRHLAKWIPWKGCDNASLNNRTKMFINILKIRLQFLIPNRCKEIVRNEAHVRMATSVWYATHWVMMAAVASIAAVAIATILNSRLAGFVPYENAPIVGVIANDFLVLAFACIVKYKIELFLHYLRVREIVYVLETAHFADTLGYKLDFKNLNDLDVDGTGGSES